MGRNSGLVGIELDSRLKGRGFESRPIQNTRWKWCQSHTSIDYFTQFWINFQEKKEKRYPNGICTQKKTLKLENSLRVSRLGLRNV